MTSTASTAPTPEAKTTASRTNYVVLQKDGNTWEFVDDVQATSARAAINAHAGKALGQPGTFVAIPARSWRPVKVTPKTTTSLVIEEA
jgi:hypothetical protein